MSKKYLHKTCAYCGVEDSSGTADHVLARQFFLKRDRHNLPVVPACSKCNTEKSDLEKYALTVLPLGSRHCDRNIYSFNNTPRRLRKNPYIVNSLSPKYSGVWEHAQNGLIIPIVSLDIDKNKITKLFSLVVRGLFMYHWQIALHPDWYADVAIIKPDAEHLFAAHLYAMRPRYTVEGNLGRGTFVYEGVRVMPHGWASFWQFNLFGGLRFGSSDSPDRAFTTLSALTRPTVPNLPPVEKKTSCLASGPLVSAGPIEGGR
jgi:hypothetical protein